MYLLVLRAFLSTNSRMPSEVGRHLNSPCGAGCFMNCPLRHSKCSAICLNAPSGAECFLMQLFGLWISEGDQS